MTHSFTSWRESHSFAQAAANQLGRDMGIERMCEYGHTVFNTRILPMPKNRYGHELRCEIVEPEVLS